MSRENEEQRPIAQTICGALQKEPNCKCLVLSVLIYGCLAAVTWCRCANVTKVVINFSKNPIKSTKHVSPCDDGYIYIPVAFMGMLYLVYLVECYHSPIRLDLLHAESQDSVLSKLTQLRLARPTIWWKAVSYHYVRRKRQITRYRNGDNYTTTQVYYERINTHAASSFYYYDYCGVKDISKELILDPKVPIAKIALTKGFAFSNMRSAAEFEEARSRFFAEQELRDDYMEMREGLDLGCNLDPSNLVAVLGNPWFTNRYVYWCFSAFLLSWPLRVIVEYKTQYADYQITKLFGVNYDTPSNGEPIRASTGQLSQPGSYMLAPSYSEALLMESVPSSFEDDHRHLEVSIDQEILPGGTLNQRAADIVPSYSEALLYERATERRAIVDDNDGDGDRVGTDAGAGTGSGANDDINNDYDCHRHVGFRNSREEENDPTPSITLIRNNYHLAPLALPRRSLTEERFTSIFTNQANDTTNKSTEISTTNVILRGTSEPNLKSRFKNAIRIDTISLGTNDRSLDNVLNENKTCKVVKEESVDLNPIESTVQTNETRTFSAVATTHRKIKRSNGTIVNPIPDSYALAKLSISKSYLSLKSILKQNRRRYTLISAEEFEQLADRKNKNTDTNLDFTPDLRISNVKQQKSHKLIESDIFKEEGSKDVSSPSSSSSPSPPLWLPLPLTTSFPNSKEREFPRNGNLSSQITQRRHNNLVSRSLIFASPIQEIFPEDPFGGKNIVSPVGTGKNGGTTEPTGNFEEEEVTRRYSWRLGNLERECGYYRRLSGDVESEETASDSKKFAENSHTLSLTHDRTVPRCNASYKQSLTKSSTNDEEDVSMNSHRTSSADDEPISGLKRSLTERHSRFTVRPSNLRRSFTDKSGNSKSSNMKRTHLNMETSL